MMLIIDIFSDYMKEKQGVNVESLEDMRSIKKQVYNLMNEVYDNNSGQDKTVQELNVIVLTLVRDFYIKKARNQDAKKVNVEYLNRDAKVYGNRKVTFNENLPEGNPYTRKEGEISVHSLDRLVLDRERQVNPNPQPKPDISQLGQQIIETAEDNDSFIKKLNSLQSERDTTMLMQGPPSSNISGAGALGEVDDGNFLMNRILMDNETQQINDILSHDPTAIFRQPISTELLGSGTQTQSQSQMQQQQQQVQLQPQMQMQMHMQTQSRQEQDEVVPSKPNDNFNALVALPLQTGESFINPRVLKHKEVDRYVSINSADRNWELDPLRYKYNINSLGGNNDLQKRYRNIESISVGKVVIPEEIIERLSVTQNLKPFFNYDFSFAYPYLMLRIDEFDDVYDGTNDHVRKAFSKLIYHRSYKAPNGRGYIILKPMQKEKKRFYPNPLSSFGKLSISILKPNGDLLNTSADSYRLFKVEYEAFNPQYLKIVTDVYFDKNEFFVGDEVIFEGHTMTIVTEGMSESSVSKFNSFINKKEGHEVKQIGGANDNGYFRSFYIQAPGTFDRVQGRFAVDTELTDTLNAYNGEFNFCEPDMPSNGKILNNSLQHTISLQLEVLIDDAKIIEKTII
jgi:hypothetical protein